MTPIQQRFYSKVRIGDGCWIWQGYVQKPTKVGARSILGYGQFKYGGRMCKAHVIAWTLEYGPPLPGRVVGHGCNVPACVRPSHLKSISQEQNMRDMHAQGRHPGAACFRKEKA